MSHAAFAAIGEGQDDHYAFCNCGWTTEYTKDRKEAVRWAADHSDPEVLERQLEDMRLTWPDLTMDQMLGLEEIPDEVDS